VVGADGSVAGTVGGEWRSVVVTRTEDDVVVDALDPVVVEQAATRSSTTDTDQRPRMVEDRNPRGASPPDPELRVQTARVGGAVEPGRESTTS